MYKAVVALKPGPPSVLQLVQRTALQSKPGWVLVTVKAFGLNRAELFTRQGDSPGVEFPRVLGIECVGVVAEDAKLRDGTLLSKGRQVACMMGGMGRQFDGGYAQMTLVPEECVFPFKSKLPYRVLAALPEMFQTTYGSLTKGLNLRAEDTLLIRGGTSSIGMMALQLAKKIGARVISTTRQPDREPVLRKAGADRVVIDKDGKLAGHVTVTRVLELIGTSTLGDSLRCCEPGGITCMTGILGGKWVWKNFQPMVDIPTGVFLTAYSGGPGDMNAAAFNDFLADVEAGRATAPLDRVFSLAEVKEAHEYMEGNKATGKLVVETGA